MCHYKKGHRVTRVVPMESGRARINFFCGLLFFCSISVIIFASVTHAGGPGTSVGSDSVSARGETHRFIIQAYSNQDLRPYVEIVLDQITSQLKRDGIDAGTVSKEDVALIIADLNGDGKEDIIAVIAGNMLFCGKFGRECSLILLVSTDRGFRRVECCMNVEWEEFPISVLKTRSHGLRDMVLNSRFVVRYNGIRYCD